MQGETNYVVDVAIALAAFNNVDWESDGNGSDCVDRVVTTDNMATVHSLYDGHSVHSAQNMDDKPGVYPAGLWSYLSTVIVLKGADAVETAESALALNGVSSARSVGDVHGVYVV
eukprot:6203209-Pleurochrysis_carterae.AAC.3